MKIATWNVNSIKARLPTVLEVLSDINCDVVCLQELKCETDAFPYMELEEAGWTCEIHGQKSYNGVGILSRLPLEDVSHGLPGDENDDQARFIEATIMAERPLRIGCLYLPNGNPAPGPKYDYKIGWMERLILHAKTQLELEEAYVLLGDYNCIPRDEDCWDPTVWEGDALTREPTRAAYNALKWSGYTDCFEATDNRGHQYTFWDYQGGAWQKDHGIRIDHLLANPQAADRLQGVEIFKAARGKTKPSDHVPVIGTFAD